MKTQEVLEYVRNEWQHALHGLSDQWHGLRQRANSALVHFNPASEAETEDGEKPDVSLQHHQWGLLPADMIEGDNELMVRLEIPGLNIDELSVSVDGNDLVISGEKSSSQQGSRNFEGANFYFSEIVYGRFERRIALPARPISEQSNEAHYADGILSISMPFSAASSPKPRAINVH